MLERNGGSRHTGAVQRFVRCEADGKICYAELTDNRVELFSAAPWNGGTPTGVRHDLADTRLLCPLNPSKILGIGRNYGAHAREMGAAPPQTPLVFMKPPSALASPGELLRLPKVSQRVDYEGELGVVIGNRARYVPREQAMDHVFGLITTCDVTARDLQKSDGQWTRAKGFDGFCPVASSITTGLAPTPLQLTTRVNGEIKQQANTSDMLFDIPQLIEFVSQVMTLEPGDLILTGTPEGVGPMSSGDVVEVSIEGLQPLTFRVADA